MSALTDAAEVLSEATAILDGRSQDMLSVLLTPADGGPDGDGYVVVSIDGETQVKRPSLAKLLTIVGGTQGRYFMDYAELTATPGEAFGQMATVAAEDPGTHVEPGGTDPVPNPGYYMWTDAATDYWKRVGNLITADIVAALTAAEAARDAILLNVGFVGVSAALDQISAVAEAVSEIIAVAGALESIEAVPALAAEVAAAVASVPVGSNLLTFTGQAPDNLGQTGDRGYSTDQKVQYLTRTATGWAPGIDAQGRIIEKDSVIWDIARGIYPSGSLATTRAQASTTLILSDPAGTVPQAVSAGQPVVHPELGLLCYQQAAIVYSAVNPVDGTVTVPVTSRLIVQMSGPGQVATSAGTATATGYGTLVSAPSAFQVLTVTVSGTVNLDFTGTTADTRVWISHYPISGAFSVPVPFSSTVGTRNADETVIQGELLAALQEPEGTLLIDVLRPHRTAGDANTVLSLNGVAALFLSDDDTATYYDGVHVDSFDVGDANFSLVPVRIALTWEAGRVSFGGGSRVPKTLPYSLRNGAPITSARLGKALNNEIFGQQALNGGILRIERLPQTMPDLPFFERYNVAYPLPSIGDILINYDARRSFRSLRGAIVKMLAGTLMPSGHWPVVIDGPGTSHKAGTTGPAGQIKQASVAGRLTQRWAAAGIPARLTSWAGNSGFPSGAGTNTYDNRLSCSAGWSGWGTNMAGNAMRATTAGCWIEYAEPTEVDHYRIYFFTGNAGSFGGDYGRVQVTVNGGAPIKTLNCSGAAGLSYADVTPADGLIHGVNSFRITTLDAKPVGIAGAIAWSSVNPHLIIVNAGTSLRTMVTIATDSITTAAPENSALEMMRKLAASLIMIDGITNDAATGVTETAYRTAASSVFDAAVATGADVFPWTSPPTGTATIAQDVQDRYARIFLAEAAKRNLTVADFHFAMGPQAPYSSTRMGIYGASDPVHLSGIGAVTGYDWQAERVMRVLGETLLAN